MRACIIFNPAARGQKAERFRRSLGTIAAECDLKLTARPGDARRLASAAVQAGYDTIIAAGGDGTLNEALNGIGDVPDGFSRVRLGVLPLGTVNVFARELKIPLQPEAAWQILRRGKEMTIDLPRIEYTQEGKPQFIYFAQLAGAGLDARAIQLVSGSLKKRIGPLAYVVAGLKALLETHPVLSISDGISQFSGQLVLAGNGRLYGGNFHVFPQAALTDGLLEVCVFPRVSWLVLIRCGITLLLRGKLPEQAVTRLRGKSFELTGPASVWSEVDGELAGRLPATFAVSPATLRVLIP
ncbi:MAG TPA: diacylglycerol kinase family protein [Verrucomicrobiae bacterium]|nr:diacylglycerol kinase family protein [Verrucomicrobiae bacterium]